MIRTLKSNDDTRVGKIPKRVSKVLDTHGFTNSIGVLARDILALGYKLRKFILCTLYNKSE